MQSIWTAGIDKDIGKRIKAEFEGSRLLLDRKIEVIKTKEETSINKIRKEDIYDKARWDSYVSDQLGYQRYLKEMVNLIKE